MRKDTSCIKTLAIREQFRDAYLQHRDPIPQDRLLWRAQSFRHMTHVMPGQTILELGCGQGMFTQQLVRVTREENPITAVGFTPDSTGPSVSSPAVEFIHAPESLESLKGRQFDFIVAMDLLDQRTGSWLLENVYQLLKPGGQLVFYESNPWNVVLKLRTVFQRLWGRPDPRFLLSRLQLYELMSEIGFIRVFSIYNDFVYAPLTQGLSWILRNLSIVLENTPAIRTLAGSILVHGQKPPRKIVHPKNSLFAHEHLRHAISVVIPCRNEEKNIGSLVTGLLDLFGEYIHEIIIVDDNSEDNTRDILRRLAKKASRIKPIFRSPPNGVGRAIADGYRAVTGQYVLSMDCDFWYLLPELRDLFDAAAEGHEVVIGSRFSRHSVLLNYPFHKIIANRTFHLLAQLMLLHPFRDLTNNLKLMRRDVVEKLQLKEPEFAVNAEIGLQLVLMGCRVKEVPISWIERTFDMDISSFNMARVGGGYWRVLRRLWLKRVFGIGAYKTLPIPKRHQIEKSRKSFFMKNA